MTGQGKPCRARRDYKKPAVKKQRKLADIAGQNVLISGTKIR